MFNVLNELGRADLVPYHIGGICDALTKINMKFTLLPRQTI